MDARELVQDHADELGASRNLDAHQVFDRLGIAERVAEAADAADTLGHVDELVDVARLNQLLEPSVDEADLRNGLDDAFVRLGGQPQQLLDGCGRLAGALQG